MHTFIRSPQHVRGVLILGIFVLLLGALPPHSSLAASKQQEINNALVDLKDGKFQRTSLSNSVRPFTAGDKIKDQVGGVRLGPIGLLKQWFQSPFRLPKALYRMGTTTIGNRMFLIGGLTPSSLGSDRVAEVWSTAVSQVDGSLVAPGWVAEPALPAVRGADQTSNPNLTTPVAEVDSPAVTSVVDSSGQNGYIYVIGGHTANGLYDFSSYAVRIGTVANGRITGWQDQVGARFPVLDPTNPFAISYGVHSATALSHSIGGVTYVYLIGGIQHYYNTGPGPARDDPLKTVFYAKVGAGGKLFNPTNGSEGWAKLPQSLNVPVGLWDATGTIDNYVASSQTNADALYIIGGQLSSSPATFSSAVQRATINPDGTLIWDWSGTLPEARNGSAAIPFRGNIYLTGGQPNGVSPDAAVLTTYVNDDLTLFEFSDGQGNGSNFLKSGTALLEKRSLHGSVLVTADSSSPNSAFLYVLGGFGTQGGDIANKPRDSVIYGKVGGGEDISSSGYASTGWYYSKPFNVAQQFSEVTVQEIDWTSAITRTTSDMDIAMEYRLSSSNDCTSATWADWIPLTGATDGHHSINGQNISTITDTVARCFQYRAFLTTDDKFATPTLLNVSIKIIIPGSPDLSVQGITARKVGKLFTGLNVLIQNVNQLAPPTLAADIESSGSFYVDLCIYGPNATGAAPILPLTLTNKQCSKAYAQVDKSIMTANTTYPVTRWFASANDQPVDLLQFFSQPGTYTVYVAVDSYVDDAVASPKGYVDEGDMDKGESNNVSAAYTFAVEEIGHGSYLPNIRH